MGVPYIDIKDLVRVGNNIHLEAALVFGLFWHIKTVDFLLLLVLPKC